MSSQMADAARESLLRKLDTPTRALLESVLAKLDRLEERIAEPSAAASRAAIASEIAKIRDAPTPIPLRNNMVARYPHMAPFLGQPGEDMPVISMAKFRERAERERPR